MFGFLLPMRLLRDRMASFGATVLDLMTSEISRFNAISSLWNGQQERDARSGGRATYKLLLVAFSICSSRAVLAEDDHQLIILGGSTLASRGARRQQNRSNRARWSFGDAGGR